MLKGDKLLNLARDLGVIDAESALKHGIERRWLGQLCDSGELVRLARGLYATPDYETSQHHSLMLSSRLVPKGVICILSALEYYEIGTHMPSQVWVALPPRAWVPQIDYPSMSFHHFAQSSFESGIEYHQIEGHQVAIYSVAKTIADCFKFRNKIGLEAALEAMREAITGRKTTPANIYDMAVACRVGTVIRPYLEALA